MAEFLLFSSKILASRRGASVTGFASVGSQGWRFRLKAGHWLACFAVSESSLRRCTFDLESAAASKCSATTRSGKCAGQGQEVHHNDVLLPQKGVIVGLYW